MGDVKELLDELGEPLDDLEDHEEHTYDDRARIGRDTMHITSVGEYTTDAGVRVSIADDVRASVSGTWLSEAPLASDDERIRRAHRAGSARIEVTHEASGAAVARLAQRGRHVGVLNFANAVTPGGGFLGGSRAQEEQLCRCSTLYAALAQDSEVTRGFYRAQKEHGSALALDLVLVTPRVVFFKDEDFRLVPPSDHAPARATVLTCAAPDLGWLNAQVDSGRAPPDSWHEVGPTLARRAQLIVDTAIAAGVDDLVLGAWGCGAFGNDPLVVAHAFKGALAARAVCFDTVTFAIWGGKSANRSAFAAVFEST